MSQTKISDQTNQKPKVGGLGKQCPQTKSESNGHGEMLYNKGIMSQTKISDQTNQKPKVGGLGKQCPQTNGHGEMLYNKGVYNKGIMSQTKISDQTNQKPKVGGLGKQCPQTNGHGEMLYNKGVYNKGIMSQTKSESTGRGEMLYNKGIMSQTNGHGEMLYNKESMNNLKVKELREIARSRGLKGWYRLRKSDLISFITSEERRRQSEATEETKKQLVERHRQERLEKATAEAKAKADKKFKSKARRQAKREESKREAERRAEVRKAESNQRRQRTENIAGERPIEKETKSQRKRRQRLERRAEEAEKRLRIYEQAQRKKNPKKARKEKKRQHRATKKEVKRKFRTLQQRQLTEPARPESVTNAINGNVRRWTISGEGYVIPENFLNSVRDGVKEVVDGVDGPKKAYAVLKCVLVKHNLKTGDRIFSDFNGHSKTHTVTAELGEMYEEMKEKMLESLSKFQKEGSGWQLYLIKGLDISVVKFNPLSGSGYSKLPPLIAKKKAVINMKNDDDQCFKWAVTRALNPTDNHPERVTKELKDQAEKLNWDGITFPTKTKDIHIWEKNNDKTVNVFGYDEDTKKVYVIRMSDGCSSTALKDQDKFINLFLHDTTITIIASSKI